MSIKFDAWEPYSRTTNVPSSTNFTACMWLKLNTTVAWSVYFSITNLTTYTQLYVDTNNYTVGIDRGGVNAWATALTQNAWAFIAISCSGTTSGTLKGYKALPGDTTFETISLTGAAITTPQLWVGGNDYDGEPPQCSLQYVKVWDAVLSEAELWQEMRCGRPVRYENLNTFLPWFNTTNATTDFSGNGYTMTGRSTPTDDEGPPVSWGVTEAGLLVPTTALWEDADTDWFEVQMESKTDPDIDTDWVFNVSRYKTGNVTFHYALMQGTTVIQEWTDTTATGTDTVLSLPITNASAITDTSNLRVRAKRVIS